MRGAHFTNNGLKSIFVAHAEKALCLICKKSISVMKDYNLKRHFEKNPKAYQSLVKEKRTPKTEILQKNFCTAVNVQKVESRIAGV